MQEFHTHTFRCKHAEGDIIDLANYAHCSGFAVLGVSDHTPLPDNFYPEIRMELRELEDYVIAYEDARDKYPKLRILLGMECEYLDRYRDFYKDELIGRWGLAYLLLGQHFFYCGDELVYYWKEMRGTKELWAYAEHLVRGIESGLFSIVAHPDAFGNFYGPWDQETVSCSRYILEAAQVYKIPLEINGNGIRKGKTNIAGVKRYLYPLDPFWELAAGYDITVVVNSDVHKPSELAPVKEAWALAQRYNLKIADLSKIFK